MGGASSRGQRRTPPRSSACEIHAGGPAAPASNACSLARQPHGNGESAQATMAVFRVVIVARPIKVGGHQADRIKTMLFAQSLA